MIPNIRAIKKLTNPCEESKGGKNIVIILDKKILKNVKIIKRIIILKLRKYLRLVIMNLEYLLYFEI